MNEKPKPIFNFIAGCTPKDTNQSPEPKNSGVSFCPTPHTEFKVGDTVQYGIEKDWIYKDGDKPHYVVFENRLLVGKVKHITSTGKLIVSCERGIIRSLFKNECQKET